jgi:alanine racemase
MDMITIDLSGIEDAQIDDEVILWGAGLSSDEVSKYANTISYELFCKITQRVHYVYV